MTFRSIFIGFFLMLSTLGFSQSFPDTLSKAHQLVEGTNIYLIPPPSFDLTDNFKGFQNPNDQTSMIMVMEIPGPYSEVEKGFNTEVLKMRGMDLQEKAALEIGQQKATLLQLDQLASGLEFSKHILIYGDETSTTLINGVFLKDSINLGQAIKQSILSTYIDLNLKADPRTALNYTIDETIGALQFHAVIGNGMLFNRDLKTPTESEDKATLITDRSFANVEIRDKKNFCIERLSAYPDNFELLESETVSEIIIDNLKGYELYAQNDEEKMYQVILFDETVGYYLFMGSYAKGQEQALVDIKKVILTFKRK